MTEYNDVIATILIFSIVVALSFTLGGVCVALWFIRGDE